MWAAVPLKLAVLAFDIGMREIKLHLEKARQSKSEGRRDTLPLADSGRPENKMIHRAANGLVCTGNPSLKVYFRNLCFSLGKRVS